MASAWSRTASPWPPTAGPGVNGVLLMKLGVILTVLAILVYASQRFPRLLVWGAAAATAVGLLGVLTNVGSLLILAS